MFCDGFGQCGNNAGIHRIPAGKGPEVIFFVQFKNNMAVFRSDVERNGVPFGVRSNKIRLFFDGNGEWLHAVAV